MEGEREKAKDFMLSVRFLCVLSIIILLFPYGLSLHGSLSLSPRSSPYVSELHSPQSS